MKLCLKDLKNTKDWEKASIRLPQFDIDAMRKATAENCRRVHSGAGNIFRGFPAAECRIFWIKALPIPALLSEKVLVIASIAEAYKTSSRLPDEWQALKTFLSERPIWFILTVCTAPDDKIQTHGVFIGNTRKCLEDAVALSQEKNNDFVEHGIKKCVVYLNDREFKSTWLGNKAVYRTRMAIADGGELIILAPGVEHFGEDPINDALIRKYGYRGRLHTLELFKAPENQDLRNNMGVAAHLIHGSSDGRFSITYAVKNISKEEIEGAGFKAADYDETAKRYNPGKLTYGYNTMPDGEEIYYIPNPALGLWINKEKF